MLSIIVYFNSIKVRLKLVCVCEVSTQHRFQFHKGTIKTLFVFGTPPA